MRITDVSALPLRVRQPDPGLQDPTQEALIVRITTDTGAVGLAECNHTPSAAHAVLLARGVHSIGVGVVDGLIGRDPEDREAIVRQLYERNVFSLRRGLGLAVLHAIDVCLWDLVAQGRGQPLWRVLWGEGARRPQPYLTVYTGPGPYERTLERLHELVERSRPFGYRAVKLEPLDDCVPVERIAEYVAAGRSLLGADVELMVDFGHRFHTAEAAAACISEIADCGPVFIETPLYADDVAEYARLAKLTDIPLAASELFESSWEYRGLLDAGAVGVVQPWPNRMGITATLRVAALARERGRRCVLAGWNATNVGIAAGVHIAAGLGPGTSMEHAPTAAYGFELRSVSGPEPVLRDGRVELSEAPGLGVSVDEEMIA